ncbi:ATP-binding cassette domain-containing protein [Thermodesulfobacteriota bacterium]
MLRFDHVTVQENGHRILDDASFEIFEGEKVAFYGKSGSGKTSILTTMVGAYIPTAGTICFRGEPLGAGTIQHIRQQVSYIGQEPVLGADRVLDAILLPFTFRANKAQAAPGRQVLAGMLQQLHLDPAILEKQTAVISGGEKQRLAIARELLLQKQIFIVDEITTGLDPHSKAAVLDFFRTSSCTLISVSHDPEWLKLCARFFRVESGRIVEGAGRPEFEYISM